MRSHSGVQLYRFSPRASGTMEGSEQRMASGSGGGWLIGVSQREEGEVGFQVRGRGLTRAGTESGECVSIQWLL